MSATSVKGGAIWERLWRKGRHGVICRCDPCLSALRLHSINGAVQIPFLSFYWVHLLSVTTNRPTSANFVAAENGQELRITAARRSETSVTICTGRESHVTISSLSGSTNTANVRSRHTVISHLHSTLDTNARRHTLYHLRTFAIHCTSLTNVFKWLSWHQSRT